MTQQRGHRGFTLIELLIATAIIGILAALAYPAYQGSVRKGHRSDAQQLLMMIANRQEQYILDARAYTANPTLLGITKDGWTCTDANCSNERYAVAITVDNAATPPTWSITATARGSQTVDGDLTLTSAGAKTLDGNPGW